MSYKDERNRCWYCDKIEGLIDRIFQGILRSLLKGLHKKIGDDQQIIVSITEENVISMVRRL